MKVTEHVSFSLVITTVSEKGRVSCGNITYFCLRTDNCRDLLSLTFKRESPLKKDASSLPQEAALGLEKKYLPTVYFGFSKGGLGLTFSLCFTALLGLDRPRPPWPPGGADGPKPAIHLLLLGSATFIFSARTVP